MSSGDKAATVVDLHGDFYTLEAIERARRAFGRFGSISVERHAPYHRVLLPATDSLSPEVLAGEFTNHVLAASVLIRGEQESRDAG